MTIESFYIQLQADRSLLLEEQLIVDYANDKNIQVHFFTPKQIRRRSLPLKASMVVVGDLMCVEGALNQLNVKLPEANSYPNSIHSYLFRNIWHTTLEGLESLLRDGLEKPIFAKPAVKLKKFTGHVFHTEPDLYYTYGASKKTKLICSDVVSWINEYRVYVVNSTIRHLAFCDGDKAVPIDTVVIHNAIKDLEASGEGYAGYCIDFGVLSTGETALIEMNTGYSIGAYDGVSSDVFGDLIVERWKELTFPKKQEIIKVRDIKR